MNTIPEQNPITPAILADMRTIDLRRNADDLLEAALCKLNAIEEECEGYADGAPDRGEASALANRVMAILKGITP